MARWSRGKAAFWASMFKLTTYDNKSEFVLDTTLTMNSEYHNNFQSVQAAAGEKLGRSVQKSLFDRLEWIKGLHQLCLPNREPLIVHCEDGNTSAWIFLVKNGLGRYSALANWYNFTYRPIFSGDYDEVTKLALLARLAKKLSKYAHSIEITPMPDEDASANLTERAFEQAGWVVFRSKVDDNHILNVKGRTFDQYWGDRPGQLRNTVRRKAKKNLVSVRIEKEFSEDDWNDYNSVYQRSWKPEEGNPEFLRHVAQREALAGCMRLGLAYIDGEPVAAQFWTVENGEALIHKLAHVEHATKSSPGTLLSVAMFQHVIDVDHVDMIDFGTGNDPYKREWMEDVRERYRLELYWPNHPLAWLPILRHYASGLVGGPRSD